jgi:hypothetical protein
MAVAMRRGVIVGDATEIVLSAVNATVEAGTATFAEEVRVRTGGGRFLRRGVWTATAASMPARSR